MARDGCKVCGKKFQGGVRVCSFECTIASGF